MAPKWIAHFARVYFKVEQEKECRRTQPASQTFLEQG